MSEGPSAAEAQSGSPKHDPETLVLRGRPRPVVRFRRGVIVGVTAAVAASLVGVAWLALEPPSLPRAAGDDASGEVLARGAPDVLAKAPSSYGEVPRLGPPLPGDLGGPILEHRRGLEGPAMDSAAQSRADRAEAERQRRAAEREAARSSDVIVRLSGGSVSVGPGRGGSAADPDAARDAPLPSPAETRAGQDRPTAFAGSEAGDTNPHRLRPPPSPWTLTAGTIIPASLITGLNSDLPGTVLAQVTQNVRDSATGRTVLIPQGARLIGRNDSIVAWGQRRAMLVWHRIVFPDGASVRLDNMPATDLSGYVGLEDEVDFHTWRLLEGIALSTLLGVGTEVTLGSDESDLVRAVRESTQRNAARAGDRITERNLDVQPTLTVRPGWPLRAVIHKDLVLKPWRG